jgi:hypothetical protein
VTRKLVVGVICAIVLANSTYAQRADDAAALNAEFVRLQQASKYAEATEVAKELLAIREKALGREHLIVGETLNDLADSLRAQGATPRPNRT